MNEKGKITPLVFDNIGGFTGLSYDGQTFYYSRVLDEVRDDPMLQIEVVNRSVSIFLDDELLYTDWPELDNRIGYLELPMQEWDRADPVLVSLPTDYAGKTLTIAQSTSPLGSEKQESTNTAVYLCSVRLYCGYAYESNLISQSAQTAYPAIILFLLGISLLCLMVYQSFHGHTDFGLFFFAGVLFLNMCSILINAPFFYKYFPLNGQPMIDYKTHAALFGVTCLLLFISTRIRGNARWILTFLAFLQGVSVGLGVACQIYFPNQPTLLYLDDFLSLIAILVTLFFAVCQSRRGISFFTSFCKLLSHYPPHIWYFSLCLFGFIQITGLILRNEYPRYLHPM